MAGVDPKLICNAERMELCHLGSRSRGWMVVFRGKKYFLKERYGEEFRNEYHWLSYLARRGFPHIPRFYGVLRDKGAAFLVQEYIEGLEPGRGSVLSDTVASRLGEVLARLHFLSQRRWLSAAGLLRRYLEDVGRDYGRVRWIFRGGDGDGAKIVDRRWAVLCHRVGRVGKATDGLIHPVAINREVGFLEVNGKSVVVHDWEAAGWGDQVFDLSRVIWRWPRMNAEEFLSAYRRTFEIGEYSDRRLKAYGAVHAFLDVIAFSLEARCGHGLNLLPCKMREAVLTRNFDERIWLLDEKLRHLIAGD